MCRKPNFWQAHKQNQKAIKRCDHKVNLYNALKTTQSNEINLFRSKQKLYLSLEIKK